MKTVEQCINATLWDELDLEIADIDSESVVGEAVVTLLNRVEAAINTTAEDGGALETDVRRAFITFALHQAAVWYFG